MVVPQPASSNASALATRPLAELFQPRKPFDEKPAQVVPEYPLAPTSSLPTACESVGSIVIPNSASGDAAVTTGKGDPGKAAIVQLNPKLAEEYYGRGVASAQKARYDDAIAELSEAIRLIPNRAQSYYSRGVAYGHKGNHDAAIADFTEAIRLNPKLAVAYYGRGCAYWRYGQNVQAEKDFAEAKRLGYSSARPISTSVIQTSLSALVGAIPTLRP